MERFGKFFGLCAYGVGSIGGLGWAIYNNEWVLAVCTLVLAAMAFPTAERIEIVNEDAGDCYMVTAFDDAGNGSRYSLCMTDETEGTFVINNIEE